MRRAAAWYVMIVFTLILVILYPLFWYWLRVVKDYWMADQLRNVWGRLTFFFGGTPWETHFEEPLPDDTPVVICPNHSSAIDIPLAALVLRGRLFKFMGKDQFLRIPLINIFFKTIDIPVDRHNKISSYKAYKRALESLDEGADLIIFPEGTNSQVAPEMLPFKNGPFKIAIDKQVPIVPVTFLDNWHIFPFNGTMLCRPAVTRAIVHKPISTVGMTADDVPFLREKVRDIIEQTLQKEYESRSAVSR